ncbi:MAG: beta-ketoacyl-ACP synthase II [Spirochaetaceae bacterium]
MPNRIVITGLGTVNPVGNNVSETWENLLAGKSGIDRIHAFDPVEWGLKTHIAGEVTGFDPAEAIGKKEARRLDRFSQFALIAASEAVAQAGLSPEGDTRYDVATVFGTGIGGANTLVDQSYTVRERGGRRVNPFTVPMLMPNAAAGLLSIKFGAWGPSFATVSACASAADAVGTAFELIRSGRAKAVITGGSEAAILPVCIAGFEQAHALCWDSNDNPQAASRPFDSTRSGFVLSEGAAVLVIEDEEFARSRGVRVIGELAGYGAATDGYHITAPEPEGRGATRAVTLALRNAGIEAGDISYVNAHGTSTEMNDKMESIVINRVFNGQGRSVAVSSTKSMTGHLGGAAGGLEALICAKVVETGRIPPNINYNSPDPEYPLDIVGPEPRDLPEGAVLSNSFGFGGHNSCLIFRPYGG